MNELTPCAARLCRVPKVEAATVEVATLRFLEFSALRALRSSRASNCPPPYTPNT